jgi:hypothetical protein
MQWITSLLVFPLFPTLLGLIEKRALPFPHAIATSDILYSSYSPYVASKLLANNSLAEYFRDLVWTDRGLGQQILPKTADRTAQQLPAVQQLAVAAAPAPAQNEDDIAFLDFSSELKEDSGESTPNLKSRNGVGRPVRKSRREEAYRVANPEQGRTNTSVSVITTLEAQIFCPSSLTVVNII